MALQHTDLQSALSKPHFRNNQAYLTLAASRGGAAVFKIKREHEDHGLGLCGSFDGGGKEALIGAAAMGSAGEGEVILLSQSGVIAAKGASLKNTLHRKRACLSSPFPKFQLTHTKCRLGKALLSTYRDKRRRFGRPR